MHATRWWLATCVVVLCLAPAARAQDVVDQQTTGGSCVGGDHQIQFFEPTGQTFIPRAPNLTAVEVNLLRYNAPFSDTLTLTVIEGSITGAFVASATRTLTYPPDPNGWYRFTFATPVAITPGLTHTILMHATNPSWGWKDEYELGNCGYADGNGIVLGDSYEGNDHTFRTYTLCGNGTLDTAEQCDDGNDDSTDGCTTSCTICGDGVLTAPEECDDGNTTGGDGCESDCTLPSCGDGIVQAPEECDDGNKVNGDCCSRGCRQVPAGNGCAGDANHCTDDTCNAVGVCVPSFNSAPCDDENACNGADTCGGGTCSVHQGDPCAVVECGGHCVGSPFPTCVRDPAGTPCSNDGNACTSDVCNGTGACTHPPALDGTACGDAACTVGFCTSGTCVTGTGSMCDPCLVCDGNGGCVPPTGLGCRTAPTRGAVVALKNGNDPSRDSLAWTWKVDGGTAKSDFGTPLASTSYGLCVFDQSGLVVGARAPAGGSCGNAACWRDMPTGFKYRNRYLTPDGIAKLELKVGSAGQGKLRVRGKGANLTLPVLGLTTPVTVRLVRSDAADCWEAIYSTPDRNEPERFKAKSD